MPETEKEVFIRGRVPEAVRARFKATCALQGRDMGDVLRELVEQWLIDNEAPTPTKKK
ncbi:hypothetical protein NDA03_25980 [Trichocoleus sp. Lan]|uniref:plasmid partition protein ParG n=1 Tax=Trichocoleus sp. Lan TaxID=2933927 RepID=UPI003298B002